MLHLQKDPRQPKGTEFMFLAAFFLAFGTGGLSAQTTTEEPDQSSIQGSLPVDATDLEPMAKIGPEEAQEKALTALRNATVEEVELQIQDGYLVYELEVHVGTEDLELELVIDAGDGRVLAAEVEDDDAEDEEEEDDER